MTDRLGSWCCRISRFTAPRPGPVTRTLVHPKALRTCLHSLRRVPLEPRTPARSTPATWVLAQSGVPGRHRGRSAFGCPQRPGAWSRQPTAGTALRAVGQARPLCRQQRPFTGQTRSPPPRAQASPRCHNHIVDDQVRRSQRPRALLLPRAAGFAGSSPAPTTPIPLGCCSCRRCRHVKCSEHALPMRAPPPGLSTARGWWEGRGRCG